MPIYELGHVVLYVTSLTRSKEFYRDVLGFPLIGEMRGAAVFGGGRTHHELLLIEIGGSIERHKTPRPGLYHIGFKVGSSPEELQEMLKLLKGAGVTILGATDHTVTQSLYILDPDNNELELYVDVSDRWRENPGVILSPPKPLTSLSL